MKWRANWHATGNQTSQLNLFRITRAPNHIKQIKSYASQYRIVPRSINELQHCMHASAIGIMSCRIRCALLLVYKSFATLSASLISLHLSYTIIHDVWFQSPKAWETCPREIPHLNQRNKACHVHFTLKFQKYYSCSKVSPLNGVAISWTKAFKN